MTKAKQKQNKPTEKKSVRRKKLPLGEQESEYEDLPPNPKGIHLWGGETT